MVSGIVRQCSAFTSYKLKDGTETNYGYGWTIYTIKGKKIVAHAGNLSGYNAHQVIIPDDNIYLITITNLAGLKATNTARKATHILLDIEMPSKKSVDSTNLNKYAGTFESPNNGSRLQSNHSRTPRFNYIIAEGARLFVMRNQKNELIASGESTFFEKNDPTANYIFSLNSKGEVIGFRREQLFAMGPFRTFKKLNSSIPTASKFVHIDSSAAIKYTGTFKQINRNDRDYIVYRNGKILYLTSEMDRGEELLYSGNDSFFLKSFPSQVFKFIRNSSNQIVELRISAAFQDKVLNRLELPFL